MQRTKIAAAAALISLSAVLLVASAARSDEPLNRAGGGQAFAVHRNPLHLHIERARKSFDGDLRNLPFVKPAKNERPEREPPPRASGPLRKSAAARSVVPIDTGPNAAAPPVPAPSASANFDGLDFATFGNGHPPDTNGDVGPVYYIQAVNTSIGIFRKSDGVRVAAFSFNDFMKQGNFGNLCDTNNFGDPVVLYDTFEDRWIITDFAFKLDAANNVINPPGSFQCFAASKSGDPVNGGWNFYSINTTGGLGDYPKFGIWPDGLYMSANMFGYKATDPFQNVRVYALNKAQMYAGAPTVQSVSFDAPANEFTLLPSNARLQAGTPPTGSPNYFSVVWNFTDAISFYEFHVDWTRVSLSTFSGPFNSATATQWAEYNRGTASHTNETVPSPVNALDSLCPRLMAQNQYSNLGGVESLWNSHTAGAGNPTTATTAAQSGVRFYQVKVSGGNVEPNASQAFTYSPDTSLFRFMPSVAVDRSGNMAFGYSTSNSTTNPAIKYAARLATDAANTVTQTETSLIDGTGTQSGSCGGGTCVRWGDYSGMSLDPDGCTFWYTNEYYVTNGLNDETRIGAFRLSQCTTVGGGGVISGTITATAGALPISGATVSLGSRNTTTDGNGAYSFANIPAGTYPILSVAAPGYNSASTSNVAVTDNGTTAKNFALDTAPSNACPADTTLSDFQTGTGSHADLTTSPGDVVLSRVAANTYASSGSLISSTKDANPASNTTAVWNTLVWNADAPQGTAVKFQIAASNAPTGPFNFVGPDGTANTYYSTSGASIAQFTGSRYLQYQAYLSTTNTTITPILHDVTVCFGTGTPQIAVEQPAGTSLASGTSSIDFGTVNPGAAASQTFTIRDLGNGNLTGVAITFGSTNAQDFTVTAPPLSALGPNSSTTFTVQFNPALAGSRTAVMHIASNDQASPFNVNLTGTRRTYSEAWRLQYFATSDNAGDASDSSDPDQDGVSNLIEFGTGTDPTKATATPGQIAVNGSNLEFTYQRSKGALADGVLFNVEWTDGLTSPSWTSDAVTEQILGEDDSFQQVKAIVPRGSGNHRFIHLRVTRP